jgi:hypothetical protein
MDDVMVETSAECKQGIDINYQGGWGYHPLVVSLANTSEVLRLVNRPGNRPRTKGQRSNPVRQLLQDPLPGKKEHHEHEEYSVGRIR